MYLPTFNFVHGISWAELFKYSVLLFKPHWLQIIPLADGISSMSSGRGFRRTTLTNNFYTGK